MVSTQIPAKISVRLLPVSSDLQAALVSVTELRVVPACRCCGTDRGERLFGLELLLFENFEEFHLQQF